VTPADDYEQRERQLHRFKRLFGELLRGEIRRNNFEPWEVALLLDLETCQLPSRRRVEILRQYERAVEKQLASGPGPPLKLSHFLVLREQRRGGQTLQPAGPLVDCPRDGPK
jgi:hypothetical protein